MYSLICVVFVYIYLLHTTIFWQIKIIRNLHNVWWTNDQMMG